MLFKKRMLLWATMEFSTWCYLKCKEWWLNVKGDCISSRHVLYKLFHHLKSRSQFSQLHEIEIIIFSLMNIFFQNTLIWEEERGENNKKGCGRMAAEIQIPSASPQWPRTGQVQTVSWEPIQGFHVMPREQTLGLQPLRPRVGPGRTQKQE